MSWSSESAKGRDPAAFASPPQADSSWKGTARILAVAAAYFLAARLGLLLAYAGTNATPIWPPTGIALAAALLWGYRVLPGVFLGAFLANVTVLPGGGFSAASSVSLALLTAAGNTLEALAGTFMTLRATGGRTSLDRPKVALSFVLFGAVLSTVISALIGTMAFCLHRGDWSVFGTMYRTWWLGDAGGALVFAPPILAWKLRALTLWNRRKIAEAAVLAAMLLLTVAVVFPLNYNFEYLFIPFLIWTAMSFGTFETAVVVLLVMGSSLFFTIGGTGPFAARSTGESLLFLQSFIAVSSVTALLLSSLIMKLANSKTELDKARQQLYDIIEFLPDPTLAIDREGRVIAWNRAIERFLGIPKTEMIGQKDYAYAVPIYGTRRPLLIDLVGCREEERLKEYENVERRGHTIYGEVYIPKLERHLSGAASLLIGKDGVPYGAIESIRDITESKRNEEELARHRDHLERLVAERETQYRDLVESANSVILRWLPDGKITFVNRFALDFFGYAEREILGRNIMGTIVPESESNGRNLSTLASDIVADPDSYARNENENMRKNGERVWMAWTNKPILDREGKVSEILSVGVDITKLVRTQQELRHALNELAKAKEMAEAADRLKSVFLATMSHELRTPLNSIIGFTGILLQGLVGDLNPEQTKQLGMVRNSANHLLSLISDVLDISKIEAGQLSLVMESFDLGGSIRKAVQTVRPLAEKKGLTLSVEVSPQAERITSDMRRVEQILLNLLSNAVKFTEHGSVAVRCGAEDGKAVIRIADTGIGIKAEDMGDIFKPFRQLDSGLTRKYEGTGLGLSICRKLADLLGGDIRAASEWGKGSTFTVTLPLERNSA